MSGRGRWQLRVWAPPLLCILLVLASPALMLRQGDGPAAEDAPASPSEVVGRVFPADPHRSAASSFLADLDSLASRSSAVGANPAVVSWDDPDGLADAAGTVLETYRDMKTFTLMTSGYLDIKGNAWGALLRGPDGSVDIALALADESGGATVRVSRIGVEDGEGVL